MTPSSNAAPLDARILVLARDPMLATLLGMFAELASFVPCFAEAGERPEEALARTRPLHVVVLDGSLDAAQSDLFFALAARNRVGLAIFGAPGRPPVVPERARARGVPYFEAPLTVADFERLVEGARHSEWWRRASERRAVTGRDPVAERAADGSLVFVDREGRRWAVYDRRTGDRRGTMPHLTRAEASDAAEAELVRLFVGDAGETWRYLLRLGEGADSSAATLERQFARATKL